MKPFKHLLIRIFCLPPSVTVLLALPSFALLAFVFLFQLQEHVLAYIAYLASAYALSITVTGVYRAVKKLKPIMASHPTVQKLRMHPLVKQLSRDMPFRLDLSLYRGMLANLLYATFKLAAALHYASVWFGAVAVYYFTLCGIRFYLARAFRDAKIQQGGKPSPHELAVCRRTGYLMLFLTVAMLGMILQMLLHNRSFQYPGVIIYASACYTFYSFITAAVYAIKSRKLHRPSFSAANVLRLDGALMSVFILQTAMLARFGASDAVFRQIMNFATGAAVTLLSAALAIFLIAYAAKSGRDIPSAPSTSR